MPDSDFSFRRSAFYASMKMKILFSILSFLAIGVVGKCFFHRILKTLLNVVHAARDPRCSGQPWLDSLQCRAIRWQYSYNGHGCMLWPGCPMGRHKTNVFYSMEECIDACMAGIAYPRNRVNLFDLN